LQEGKITLGHAKALLSAESQERQEEAGGGNFSPILFSVREVEKRVKKPLLRKSLGCGHSREEKKPSRAFGLITFPLELEWAGGKLPSNTMARKDLERLYSLIVEKKELFEG